MSETTQNVPQATETAPAAAETVAANKDTAKATNAPKGAENGNAGKGGNAALFELLNKVLDSRADGLAKSTLKSNGVESDEEAKAIISAWKESRTAAQQQATETVNAAQQENAALKAQIMQMRMDGVAQVEAAKMGIDAAQLAYVVKLADMTACADANGNPDAEKVAAALKKVLDDVPAFAKTAADNHGFVKIGSGSTTTTDKAKTQNTVANPGKRWNRFK